MSDTTPSPRPPVNFVPVPKPGEKTAPTIPHDQRKKTFVPIPEPDNGSR